MKFKEFLNEPKMINESINDKGILHACFMSGQPGCFDENTLIKTNDGYKKIKDVKINELVLTYNEFTKENEWNIVEKVFEYLPTKIMMELEFENGEKVICTEDHKFFVNGNWIEAKNL